MKERVRVSVGYASIATSIVITHHFDGVKKMPTTKTTTTSPPTISSPPSTLTPATAEQQKFAIFIFIMDVDGNVSLESRWLLFQVLCTYSLFVVHYVFQDMMVA